MSRLLLLGRSVRYEDSTPDCPIRNRNRSLFLWWYRTRAKHRIHAGQRNSGKGKRDSGRPERLPGTNHQSDGIDSGAVGSHARGKFHFDSRRFLCVDARPSGHRVSAHRVPALLRRNAGCAGRGLQYQAGQRDRRSHRFPAGLCGSGRPRRARRQVESGPPGPVPRVHPAHHHRGLEQRNQDL